MKKTRNSFCYNEHVPFFTAVMQVLSKPCTLQGIAVTKEDTHVTPNPLLDKHREECRGKAEDEGHEPESIQADVK
jgi:hypothetical protein